MTMRSAWFRPESFYAALVFILALGGCTDAGPSAPSGDASEGAVQASLASGAHEVDPEVLERVRRAAAERGLVPLARAPLVRSALVELGQALLFDKILSGNRDISCMSCHLPAFGTGDGRMLSIGQGASGLGPDREHPDGAFIPRNAPALFNLHEMDGLFWDGRVELHASGELTTPAGSQLSRRLTRTFEFGAISALGMFPVLSREEMRGHGRSNELARVPDHRMTRVWRRLMRRLGRIPEYVELFEEAYPGTRFRRMTFAHASNAMAGFLVAELATEDAPWDRFLKGDDEALDADQLAGADVFTSIRCSVCHTGPTLSDGLFHNVALVSLGPGQGDGSAFDDDFGRMRVTGDPEQRYAFRTTPLRNVELTAPYGHAGQFRSLNDFIDHYSESELKLREYVERQGENVESLLLPSVLDHNFDAILSTRSEIIEGVVFDEPVTDALVAFMSALTDDPAHPLSALTPRRVPSGLPVN